jgi:hypothetical protein
LRRSLQKSSRCPPEVTLFLFEWLNGIARLIRSVDDQLMLLRWRFHPMASCSPILPNTIKIVSA